MLGIAPLGAAVLGGTFAQIQPGGGGDTGGGPGGGTGPGTGGGSGLPAASYIDRRGVLSGAISSAVTGSLEPGLGVKLPVRVATTGEDVTLYGLQSIDGVTLAEGDRVLLKDQNDPTQNGIRIASVGPWRRAGDADDNSDIAPGMIIDVTQGALNAGTIYTLVGASTMQVIVDTTALQFASVSLNPPVAFDPILDSGDIGLVPGLKVQLEVPARMRLQQWTLFAEETGSIVIDIWRAPFAMLPLTLADSITGATPPTLVTSQFARSNDLAGWDIDLAPGDILGFSILSVSGIARIKLSLTANRPL